MRAIKPSEELTLNLRWFCIYYPFLRAYFPVHASECNEQNLIVTASNWNPWLNVWLTGEYIVSCNEKFKRRTWPRVACAQGSGPLLCDSLASASLLCASFSAGFLLLRVFQGGSSISRSHVNNAQAKEGPSLPCGSLRGRNLFPEAYQQTFCMSS